jgi:hypothetical protein
MLISDQHYLVSKENNSIIWKNTQNIQNTRNYLNVHQNYTVESEEPPASSDDL